MSPYYPCPGKVCTQQVGGPTIASEQGGAVAFRCPRCGAPLEVTPDTVVVVCRSCGYAYYPEGRGHPVMALPVLYDRPEKLLEGLLERWPSARWMRGKAVLHRAHTVYLPAILFLVEGRARYRASVNVRYKRFGDDRVDGEWVKPEGEVEWSGVIAVPARRGSDPEVTVPTARLLAEEAAQGRLRAYALERFDWRRMKAETLAADVSPAEARASAVDEAIDTMREEAKKDAAARAWRMVRRGRSNLSLVGTKVSGLDLEPQVTIVDVSPYILAPVTTIEYRVGDSLYRAAFAAWNNRLLWAERPLSRGEALAGLSMSVLFGGISGALGLSSLILLLADPLLGIGGGIASVFLAGLASRSLSSAMREVEVLRPLGE